VTLSETHGVGRSRPQLEASQVQVVVPDAEPVQSSPHPPYPARHICRSRAPSVQTSRLAGSMRSVGQSVRTSSLVGRRSDLEGAVRGELAPVVLVVLGWVVVNVTDRHNVLEVGIPADREVHRESECALGLPGEAAA
jgi:hypothetical protein